MGDRWDDTDWYRSSTWDEGVAAAFEVRLRRARPTSRAQYVRIQGTHLAAQDDIRLREAGRTLFRRVIDEYEEAHKIEALTAREQLGDSLADDGFTVEAEAVLRQVLADAAVAATGRSGTSHVTELRLAELLLAQSGREPLAEADALLDEVEPQITSAAFLRGQVLRFLVCRARVAAASGDTDRARVFAAQALEVAAETSPSLPRHPDVGRPHASPALLAELRELAATGRSRRRWGARRRVR